MGILYFPWQPKYIPLFAHAHSSILVLDVLMSSCTYQISSCPSRPSSTSDLHETCLDHAFLI